MEVGDIYNLDGRFCKIIMLDEYEVFHGYLEDDGKMKYTNAKTLIYFRTPREYFESNSEFISPSKFTTKETEIHRPDLPLRLHCFETPFWTNQIFTNIENFKSFLQDFRIDVINLKDLNTNKVVIFPSGQQQSLKKPILLESKTGSFSGIDLLFRCFQIQSEYIKIEKPYFSRFRLIRVGREEKRLSGIGIYRLGIKGNMVSYYLGGHMSSMELEDNDSLIVQ
jgi:hypothetical protein